MFSKKMTRPLVFGLNALILSTAIDGSAYAANQLEKIMAVDFTGVAKSAIPAVVSITVKGHKGRTSKIQDDADDPFGQSWLEKFFGMPDRDPGRESGLDLSQGSGFLVSKDGYIVTNRHVINRSDEIVVTLNDGREFPGKVIGQDSYTDVAVIKINADGLPFLPFGNSDDLQVGQWVVAIGTPLGLRASLTTGVVSAKGRNNLDLTRIEDFIQTDAVLNRGNSGGPLLNLQGQVIGINTAIASNMGGYMGIGFAIPSNIAKNAVDQLIANGNVKRGFIGVLLQQMDHDLANAFGLEQNQGIVVAEVKKGSPAEKARLQAGDVILKYNATPVNNIGSFRTAIALMPPNSKVTLLIERKGSTSETVVTVGDASTNDPKEAPASDGYHESPVLGLKVRNITPEIMESLNIKDSEGVIVTHVAAGSIAKWAGLRPGNQIIEVNHQKVNNIDEFQKALEKASRGKPLLLMIKDNGAVKFLSLKFN